MYLRQREPHCILHTFEEIDQLDQALRDSITVEINLMHISVDHIEQLKVGHVVAMPTETV